ncbi:MAG: hypothetical protein HYR64_06125 [Fimbriimonas ginsengisoli]|uniref:Uncharacterized protein n=1 Tax=Fimbriimonas ginsengisoli TaxID=1005039 RepID=A0A931LSJ4_FIMGI|nr:hypothetical protein [Fimbriimonas ginsengisoli]
MSRHQGYNHLLIPFPPDVILAHELGHTQGADDPPTGAPVTPYDNVGLFENPYRVSRGLPIRAYYGPSIEQVNTHIIYGVEPCPRPY